MPLSLLGVAFLALVHLYARYLRFLDVIPRSRLLSIAGGMSVAYVFLRILPEIGNAQVRVGQEAGDLVQTDRYSIYLVAMLGLVIFYGLERLADRSRSEQFAERGENCPSPAVFWISIASYAIVNFLVGYLLYQREQQGAQRFALFFGAMAVWFIVNDYGIRAEHHDKYRMGGRWVLICAVFGGWIAAVVAPLPDLVISLALAFVGGGVVMNVLKEELPRERASSFWSFAAGAAGYGALLLSV